MEKQNSQTSRWSTNFFFFWFFAFVLTIPERERKLIEFKFYFWPKKAINQCVFYYAGVKYKLGTYPFIIISKWQQEFTKKPEKYQNDAKITKLKFKSWLHVIFLVYIQGVSLVVLARYVIRKMCMWYPFLM